MEEELRRKAIRKVLYRDFKPPRPRLREGVLASLPASIFTSREQGWLYLNWPHLLIDPASATTVIGVAVILALDRHSTSSGRRAGGQVNRRCTSPPHG